MSHSSFISALLALGAPVDDSTIVDTRALTLKVADAAATADAVIREAESRKGFVQSLSDQDVVVRVPSSQLDGLVATVEGLGLILSRESSARDIGESLAQQRVELEARRKTLQRYFRLLERAPAEAVVTVEQQVLELVLTIETLAGRIRAMERDLELGTLAVRFREPSRRPPTQVDSPFPWIRGLHLDALREAFER